MEIFADNEIVWAKVKGYPWWPAIVLSTFPSKQQKYLVNFIGDPTQ
jgi:hypothetical protein